jgi:hypothetical protein
MTEYHYKCVAAPRRARKNREHRTPSEALVAAFEAAIAVEAAAGWEYLRTDLVPMEAKSGWFSSWIETHQGVMIFRRPADATTRIETLDDRPSRPRAEPRLGRPTNTEEPEIPRLGAARIE